MATYTVTGPNADMADWSVSGADAGDFSISSAGVLTFNTAPDYGTDNVYDGDGGGGRWDVRF